MTNDQLEKYLNTANDRLKSNSENYDKAILTLSSAALTLSLVFISKFEIYQLKIMIIISWYCFTGAIFCILFSFLFGQLDITRKIAVAKEYYDDDNKQEKDINRKSLWYIITVILNWCGGILFLLAFIMMIFFTSFNLYNGDLNMKSGKKGSLLHIYLPKTQ